ncbi:MAG: exonuclease domain-containing protein [Desulfobacterales bacterium]|nr:exonuclease domain-containing protein [Desulfobacterales bacterium]
MAETFLFYDIETTGLSRAFDQILEFAAIRTDEGLAEIARFSARIRLRPDVIPSPAAMLVNRLRMTDCLSGRSEYDALREIHAELNRPGTVSIGYNSIGFDDEFLRFAFHRNLLPPYTHQFANGCRRMDLFPVTLMYWLYRRDLLRWPDANGKPSLKLEEIGAANDLFSSPSHQALADVEAALRLTRLLFKDRPMWQYLDGCFRKEVDARRIEELPAAFSSPAGEHRLAILVAGELGTRQRFQAPVLALGASIPYPKQSLWLRLDTPALRACRAETIPESTWVFRKRAGEPGILLPPTARYLEVLEADRREEMEKNLAWIRSQPALFEAIAGHHRRFRYPFIPGLDPDAGLYQTGFWSRADEALCRAFHAAPAAEKALLAERFAHPEAANLARRVLFRNFEEALSPELIRARELHIRRICDPAPMSDFNGRPRTTPAAAVAEILRLKAAPDLDEAGRRILDELHDYITGRFGGLPTAAADS